MNFEGLQIEGDIMADEATLVKYSRDASIFLVRPEAVVFPKNSDDIKKLVKWVSENKSAYPELSLTARAAGTDMTGGPLNESIILDTTKYLNQILELKLARGTLPSNGRVPLASDGYAVTEPGVYYKDFEAETKKKGLLLPSYPASKDIAAMGGIINNNAGGEKSLLYGKTEKYVQELTMVLSDGNEHEFKSLNIQELEAKKAQQNFEGQIYRQMHELIEQNHDAIQKAKPDVSKNSAGYNLWDVLVPMEEIDPVRSRARDGIASPSDRGAATSYGMNLTKLFVGAQGTLGIMTKAKLELIKPKKYSKLLVIFLKDLAPLGKLVNEVLRFKPESFECYDDQTLKIAVEYLPQLIKQLKGGIFSILLKFIPELKMALIGGIPKLVLIAEFTSDEEYDAFSRLAEAEAEIIKFSGVQTHRVTDTVESDKYWIIRRESFNMLRHHAGVKHTAPFIDDTIVHPSQLPEFLPKLNKLISQYEGLTYTIAGHAGDANFHVIPLMDFHDEANRKAIPELSEKVYDLVASMHGSITAEHNDGIIRTPYLPKMYLPEMIELFKRTKQIFDPQNIFNPGKKVGGSLQYSLNHIIWR